MGGELNYPARAVPLGSCIRHQVPRQMPTEIRTNRNLPAEEKAKKEEEVTFDWRGADTDDIDLAFEEMELQERIAKTVDPESEFVVIVKDDSEALDPMPVTGFPEEQGEAAMEQEETLADKYPDFVTVFDLVMKSYGLTSYAQLTPEFLEKATALARKRGIAHRASLGIKALTPEQRREEVAKAYALIDELAGPR
jgi:hypothetical protein